MFDKWTVFGNERGELDVVKLDTGCWKLDAGCWMLDAGNWKLDAGCELQNCRTAELQN